MSNDFVRVPEGHQVTTYVATDQPNLGQARSGVWVLNLGNGEDLHAGLDTLEEFLESAHHQNVCWFLRSDFVEALPDRRDFLARVDRILQASRERVGHLVVFVKDGREDPQLMTAFSERGVGVHYSAPDGTCFVEVVSPRGIQAGMPGPPFQASFARDAEGRPNSA